MANTNNFQKSQDTLYALRRYRRQGALGQHDLSQGVVQAQNAITSYYVVGYYSANTHGRAVPPHQDHVGTPR